MIHVEAPEGFDGRTRSVFLAGGITDCPDWQAEVAAGLADLPVAVLNPRRAAFEDSPEAAAEQIGWEFRHLAACDTILFWFPGSRSVQPIALYELGMWAGRTKPIVVGADPAYARRLDVSVQLSHVRPGLVVHDSLEKTIVAARASLKTM
ncbi:nucleoside 2-deoxyribosyltransferase domain-containing protein [Planotetraspora kaengkrachanensis]|uniref:Nucleoside 2-deoxyribosyltransferase-like protein n=1 Tax=Planotetraspora kaengkrachanensis TaxID=575193 RepID=A0A8J3PTY1_9ACTN|nr:nucleoside 2-deoxyribosyltransferase domain-containing protein [Planotetraspora kaengkrachanensis]GIG80987.1 hypothetical protein Pka01_41140 [Planotetraspora kaengkrachanensis]